MNMAGHITTITSMNEKLDRLTEAMKEMSNHTGQLTNLLRQLIKERVEDGRYTDLLLHPMPLIREWTREYLDEKER